MWIAEYSDRYDDYISLGKTRKEAEQSLYLAIANNSYQSETELLADFDNVEEFIDSEINVYKLNCGEALKTGYGTRYKDGKEI